MGNAEFDQFILANMPHFIAVNYQRLYDFYWELYNGESNSKAYHFLIDFLYPDESFLGKDEYTV